MACTIIRPANHDEWLKHREKGIGSSEVGTILGVNPFETCYQLWRRKKGIDPPLVANEAMRAGTILEGAVATYFEQESGYQVIKASQGDWLAIDKDREYLRVSPDRTYWLEGKHSKDNKGIVECKTTQLDVDYDNIPQHWFCQLIYQLGVMNYRQGSLAWLTRGRKFGYREIEHDADFYGYMADKLEKFWVDSILGDIEPPVTTIDDVMLKFPKAQLGKTMEISDELLDELNVYKSLKPQIDELTRQKKEVEEHIKQFMTDAEALCLPGTKEQNPMVLVTWKTAKDSTKFDEKRFKAENPELYSKYLNTVAGSRRFLVK